VPRPCDRKRQAVDVVDDLRGARSEEIVERLSRCRLERRVRARIVVEKGFEGHQNGLAFGQRARAGDRKPRHPAR